MLKDEEKIIIPDDQEIDKRLDIARAKMFDIQTQIKEKKLPVIVLFEGWGASGKGNILGKVIKNIDPRFYRVSTLEGDPSPEELRRPFLYRYFSRIPQQGQLTFFDSGWMQEVTRKMLRGEITDKQYRSYMDSIKRFERTLNDNGYLVVKFFFQISQKEQRKRLDELAKEKNTRWRVKDFDNWQNKHYDRCEAVYEKYLYDTNLSSAPWYQINSKNKKWAELQVLETLISCIETAIKNSSIAVQILQNTFPLNPIEKIQDIDLNKTMSDEEYKQELKACQDRLKELHNILYRKKIPVIIGYEGWDAAGKGGNIRRVSAALDPRGFEVMPIASPEPHEKARHFLWRFWTRLPKTGHITIFDRTWYGRVMVERLEGFCSENDWQRAYNEINEFEKELSNWGAVVIKFWVQIDKDTQLARFNDRQNTPEKQWKITEEDWRNREKWDEYEVAVNEMLQKTNTTFAPWYILESNDKHYARIKAMKIIIAEVEKKIAGVK